MKNGAIVSIALVCAFVFATAAPHTIGVDSKARHTDASSDTLQRQFERMSGAQSSAVAQREQHTIDPSLQNTTGVIKIVVRLRSADITTTDTQTAVRTLTRHAERTQRPIVSYANDHHRVEVRKRLWLANAVLLTVNTSRIDLREIARIEGVERLHRNIEMEHPAPIVASENSTIGNASAYNTTDGIAQINATAVWEQYGTRGTGVKVAVLDTGVDVSHPDIDLYTDNASNDTYPGGWAEFDANGNRVTGSTPHDTASHGTHVSGTVAGGNASGQYVGVAPDAQLLHGLVIPNGSGTFTQIVAGMQWAIDNGASVISMSIGSSGHVPTLIEPVRNAETTGTTVVAAAGNAGANTSSSPGNVYETIAVGASNETLGIASFSSGEVVNTSVEWGSDAPSDWPATYVVPDVAAPGVAVNSTVPGGGYSLKSGTSMATPHVAGAAALLISVADGGLSPTQVKAALYQTAVKPANCAPDCAPRAGNDTRYGAGIIDVGAAAETVAGRANTNRADGTNTAIRAVPSQPPKRSHKLFRDV